MSRDFFVADFEFTQYTKRMGRPRGFFSEIIEIGAVKIDGNSLAVTGKIQNFVHPHFYPKQAKEGMDFCMITEKDMESAIEFGEMLEQIKALYVPGQTYFVAWVMRIIRWWRKAADGINLKILFYLKTILIWRQLISC